MTSPLNLTPRPWFPILFLSVVFSAFFFVLLVPVPLVSAQDLLYRTCDKKLPNGKCPVLEIEKSASEFVEHTINVKHGGLWVVCFYASWCPHCQHYAPEFKALATEYTMLDKRAVKFAAIACDVQGAVCGENNVQSYPTMKIFHFIAEDENDRVVNSRPSELRTKIDQALEKLPNGGKIPGSSSNSASASSSSSSSGSEKISEETSSTALTVKPADPNTEYNPVTKDASGNVMFGKWKFSGEPALSLNKRLHDAAVGLVYGLKITTFLKAEKGIHLSAEIWKSLQSWLEFVSLTFPRATFRDDLVALLRNMQMQVTPESTGPDEWRQVLLHWAREDATDDWGVPRLVLMEPQSMLPITMLRATKSFTGTMWTLLHILGIVVDKEIAMLRTGVVVEGKGSSSSSSGSVGSITNSGKGSSIPFDWSVFGAADQSRMVSERKASSFAEQRKTAEELLKDRFFMVLRDWIENFFGCGDCREHFLAEFERCAYGRCDPDRPVSLYLWEQHNHVTQRVSRERQHSLISGGGGGGSLESSGGKSGSEMDMKTQMEEEEKKLSLSNVNPLLLWPSFEDCPKCYNVDKLQQLVDSGDTGASALMRVGRIVGGKGWSDADKEAKEGDHHGVNDPGAGAKKESVFSIIFRRRETAEFLMNTFGKGVDRGPDLDEILKGRNEVHVASSVLASPSSMFVVIACFGSISILVALYLYVSYGRRSSSRYPSKNSEPSDEVNNSNNPRFRRSEGMIYENVHTSNSKELVDVVGSGATSRSRSPPFWSGSSSGGNGKRDGYNANDLFDIRPSEGGGTIVRSPHTAAPTARNTGSKAKLGDEIV